MTTDISALEFVPGLPIEQLRSELAVANTISALGRRKLARYLFDMQERGVAALSGHHGAVHYATARLGMDRRRAQELVQIGRRLDELPEVDAALVSGELSWSKLRALLRVVVPETQGDWLQRAEESSCQKLSAEVARCLPGERPKQPGTSGLTDIRMTVRADLLLINHQLWEQARRKLAAELDMPVTNADMMVQVARLILSTDADGKIEGRTAVRHALFQLIVHERPAEAEQAGRRTTVHTDQGEVELTPEQAQRVAARAERVRAAAPVANPNGKTPPWLVKRVLARENRCCANCGGSLYLQVHHVDFRAAGGKTEEDRLVALCTTCHSLIHAGLLAMHSDGAGGFLFLDRSGTAVEQRGTPVPAANVRGLVLGRRPRSSVEQLHCALELAGTRRELAPARTRVRIPGAPTE